ncbi:Predicted gene 4779 [Apodemus speciosus]|uniref:Predicted gene 4779 n=1 Tax=Apodemus speciosus TaxID=105296 RepID=A0ABQ0FUW2_APOSI
MSSPDEVSFRGRNLGPESGEHSERRRFTHGFPRGHGLGPEEKLLRSREDKMCLPVSKTFQCESWLDKEDMEGRSVIWGCEGRPGTPVDERGDSLDFVQQLAVEGTSFGQHVANREAWGVHRHPSPQACAAEAFAIWGDSDASTLRRSARPLTSKEGRQYSAAQLHPRGPGRGRAWMTPRRSATSRMIASDDVQYPSSDPESSDEFSEIQMMRVTICLKEGSQPKATELEDPARHANVHGRESLVHVPPSLLATTTPRGLGSGIEKQASGDQESSLSKKKQSMVWGKEGSRTSHQGTTAAAAATASASAIATTGTTAPVAVASGGLPKTSPRKKPAQEKPSQWDASRGPIGRTFPPWGQRLKSAPVEPATFPPISGVALLGKASKCSLPSGPKECKPFCTGKKSVTKRTKETQAAPKDDNPPRDPGPQAQVPPHRAEQPSMCMHRAEMSSGDSNPRAPQVSGTHAVLVLEPEMCQTQSTSTCWGDQEVPLRLPFPVGDRPHPVVVVQAVVGCQQCLMLQKEIDELKEQLDDHAGPQRKVPGSLKLDPESPHRRGQTTTHGSCFLPVLLQQ